MKEHGWKRVESLNVETWFLTENDCAAIKHGLMNIYGSDVLYQCINLYVYSTEKFYVQLPMNDLRPRKMVNAHVAE